MPPTLSVVYGIIRFGIIQSRRVPDDKFAVIIEYVVDETDHNSRENREMCGIWFFYLRDEKKQHCRDGKVGELPVQTYPLWLLTLRVFEQPEESIIRCAVLQLQRNINMILQNMNIKIK